MFLAHRTYYTRYHTKKPKIVPWCDFWRSTLFFLHFPKLAPKMRLDRGALAWIRFKVRVSAGLGDQRLLVIRKQKSIRKYKKHSNIMLVIFFGTLYNNSMFCVPKPTQKGPSMFANGGLFLCLPPFPSSHCCFRPPVRDATTRRA